MKLLLMAAAAALVVYFIVKLMGGSADVSGDPCIGKAVDFFRAVRGIPKKSQYTQCWIDLYPGQNLVCRFFENSIGMTRFQEDFSTRHRKRRSDARTGTAVDCRTCDDFYERCRRV